MPQTPHIETTLHRRRLVREHCDGMSDGLTVPFALAAGLTARPHRYSESLRHHCHRVWLRSPLVRSQWTGGYLAAKSDAEHYSSEREREYREVQEIPKKKCVRLPRCSSRTD